MSRKNKIFIFISIVLLLIAIGVGIYFGLQRLSQKTGVPTGGVFPTSPSGQQLGQERDVTTPPGQAETDGQYTDPNLIRLTQLTKGPVVDYFVVSPVVLGEQIASSSVQSAIFYIKENGDVVRVYEAGREETYFSFGLTPLYSSQSPTGSFVVIKLLSGKFAFLDVAKRVFELLPEGTVSATFSADEKKLAYLVADLSGRQSLFVKNIATAKRETTKVFSLFIDDVSLAWPVGNRIYLLPPESFQAFQTVWYFDMISKTVGSFANGSGVGALFSPVSSHALVFQNKNNTTITARITDTKADTNKTLSLSTLRSKCAFASDSADAVCAVPQIISKTNGVVLPDDYNILAAFTNDYLYLLPAENMYAPRALLSVTSVPFDASNVRARSNQLFFINRLDDSLYVFTYEP